MGRFADQIRSGAWTGHTGRRIRNIVNIGIGGSDLGPSMAYEALENHSDRALTVRFVSNIDGTDFWEATRDLDPAETLFVVVSKTFTTLETMTNARTAKAWTLDALGDDGGGGQPLRRRVHEPRRGRQVRHRPRQHVRVLGLGRRPLLVRLGGRAVADDRHRARPVRRDAGRLPRHRRALPHRADRAEHADAHGPDRHLVRRLLRGRDPGRAALRPVPGQAPGLPAAARHGEQRQVGHPRRRARRRTRPARSCGASRAPTASTPTTSSSTRARS